MRIINEPTASALAYGTGQRKMKKFLSLTWVVVNI
jgi:molecular chaperone DnaK (HSP70)